MWAWGRAAFASPEAISVVVGGSEPVEDRVIAGDGAAIAILYVGEQHGRIGPCGCDNMPRGGIGRVATWNAAVREADPRVLLVNPGAWASSTTDVGTLSAGAIRDNGWFHRGWYELRFDAANVSFRDLPSLAAHPGLVSATHRPEAPVARYKSFDVDGLRVAVTGVSRDGLEYLRPPGLLVREPVDAVDALLPELADHDLVVVLAYDVPRDVERIASLPGVDVVIEAAGYTERWPPLTVGDAVWVRSRDDGTELGELRLWVDNGVVVRAVDRRLPLGPDIPIPPRFERLLRLRSAGE